MKKSIFSVPLYSSKSKQIVSQFSAENYQFVLMVLKEIIPLIDFSLNGKVSYNLQSPSGHPNLIKERLLLKKLEQQGLFRHLGEDGIFGITTLDNLDIPLIKEVVGRLEEKQSGVISPDEPEEINNENSRSEQGEKTEGLNKKKDTPDWQDDFEWEGNKFVFGVYGRTALFSSKTRLKLFHELTNAKGGWVKVVDLKKIIEKNEAYIRPTIGQIERSFHNSLRDHISIPSTESDDLQPKPLQGAYRIKFTLKSS